MENYDISLRSEPGHPVYEVNEYLFSLFTWEWDKKALSYQSAEFVFSKEDFDKYYSSICLVQNSFEYFYYNEYMREISSYDYHVFKKYAVREVKVIYFFLDKLTGYKVKSGNGFVYFVKIHEDKLAWFDKIKLGFLLKKSSLIKFIDFYKFSKKIGEWK